MNSGKDVLNEKYAALCQQKGDLLNQRSKIDELLEQIEREIEAINAASKYLPEIQTRIVNDVKRFEKVSKVVSPRDE